MSSLNEPENFAGRVNFAAFIITQGKPTSRSFDNCFENNDGDAVCAALIRRAQTNERLAANLFRYINKESATEAAKRLEGQKLATAARAMRAASKAKFDAWLKSRDLCEHGNSSPCLACVTPDQAEPRDPGRERTWMEIRAKSPMRARSTTPVADVNECPLFIAANEPRLI